VSTVASPSLSLRYRGRDAKSSVTASSISASISPVYAAPPVYAYAGPVWRGGWGHRGHLHGRW
jgi:hypothetical protein